MEKFSVKKPFTVLVAVIMVLMLGFVSISNMQTNLLPDVNTPYLMVVTVYPGASPERVESEVSDVMQNALGTVAGVEKVTATSAENYSLLLMQFSDDTDMNSAMVKVSNKVDQTTASLPSSCLTPSIIEYSLNMNAFMTVGSLSSSLGSWGRQRRSTVRIGVPVLSRRPLPVSRSAVKDAVFPKSITVTASRSPRRPWDAAARNSTVSTRYTPAADTSSVLLSTFV